MRRTAQVLGLFLTIALSLPATTQAAGPPAIPGKAPIGGVWVKVADQTLPTDAMAFAPVTGLDLDGDGVYRLLVVIKGAGLIYLFFNGDSDEEHYLNSWYLGATIANTNDDIAIVEVDITRNSNAAPNVAFVSATGRASYGNQSPAGEFVGMQWTVLGQNVTQIQVSGDVNYPPFRAGSRLVLLKLAP